MTENPRNGCVLVVSEFYGGGAEESMQILHETLNEMNFPVLLLSIKGHLTEGTDSQVSLDLNTGRVPTLASLLPGLLRYRKIMKNSLARCVVLNCELAEVIGAFSTPRKIRIIVVEHTSRPWRGRILLGILVRSLLKLRGAAWVSVNPERKEIWPFKDQAAAIPNPIKRETGFNSEKLQMAFLGRLVSDKRPYFVIECAKELGIPAHIFGDGPLFDELVQLAGKADVTFHGFVRNVWSQIPKNTLIVVPSVYEGDGRVVAEAIVRGNPVLLADNEDLRKFVLSEIHFFKSVDELKKRLREAKSVESWSEFVPAKEVRDQITYSRDRRAVGEKWLSLLKESI